MLRLMVQSVTIALVIVLPKTTAGQINASVLSFKSSIERSNRTFACRGEVVTYYCVTYGTQLEWEIDNHTTITFGRNDTALSNGMKHYDDTAQKTYWAILNEINNETQVPNYRYCHSMLIVSPGELDSENLTLIDCPQYTSSKITCSAIGDNPVTKGPLKHQIAAFPKDPMPPQCSYDPENGWATIEVQMLNDNQTDLDFYEIMFNNLTTETRRIKRTDDGNTKRTSCYADLPFDGDISVSVRAVDKCGQRSTQLASANCNRTQMPDPPTCTITTASTNTETSYLSNTGFWSVVIGAMIAAAVILWQTVLS